VIRREAAKAEEKPSRRPHSVMRFPAERRDELARR